MPDDAHAAPELDHVVLGCADLDAGRAALEARLGAPAQGGGVHEGAGTWNALWGLGPVYLELIAPDPDQPGVSPLPFGLSEPWVRTRIAEGPALLTWMARCTGLDALAARAAPHLGPPRGMSRGGLAWRLALPPDLGLPFEGVHPGLIEWPGGGCPPAEAMADGPLRLRSLVRRHDPAAGAALAALGLALPEGETAGAPLAAVIDTPGGPVAL